MTVYTTRQTRYVATTKGWHGNCEALNNNEHDIGNQQT